MNQALVESFTARRETAGVFLDFDGTLSHIVHRPGDARPVEGTREVLADLVRSYGLVAVVSGRSAHDLLEWLGPQIEIWGVHGAERTVDGTVVLSDRAKPFEDLMRAVHDEAAEMMAATGIEGIFLEDKRVMLGLHFRAAEDVPRAEQELEVIAASLAEKHGLRRAGGRLAYELRPPEEFTKAAVVLDRSRELGLNAGAFVGDDRVDLPGFDALDLLAGEGDFVSLRVAVDSEEGPPELMARADVVVDGPPEAVKFLRGLIPKPNYCERER